AIDAKGLIKTACRLEDPVIFFEHKGLYRQVFSKRPEPGADYLIPFGQARLVREGSDLTAVTWGSGVIRCEAAAEALAQQDGVSMEAIDLRPLVSMDFEALLASGRKTGRALVAYEAILLAGPRAGLAARVAGRGVGW